MNPGYTAKHPPSNSSKKGITYQEVCAGKSGYVEVLLLELNDPQAHFEDVIRFFFGIHDPTTANRQGGTQYSSIILCADEHQKRITNKVMDELEHLIACGAVQCFERNTVTTKVVDLAPFTEASARHQEYLSKNANGYW